jgi:hypothetical protein
VRQRTTGLRSRRGPRGTFMAATVGLTRRGQRPLRLRKASAFHVELRLRWLPRPPQIGPALSPRFTALHPSAAGRTSERRPKLTRFIAGSGYEGLVDQSGSFSKASGQVPSVGEIRPSRLPRRLLLAHRRTVQLHGGGGSEAGREISRRFRGAGPRAPAALKPAPSSSSGERLPTEVSDRQPSHLDRPLASIHERRLTCDGCTAVSYRAGAGDPGGRTPLDTALASRIYLAPTSPSTKARSISHSMWRFLRSKRKDGTGELNAGSLSAATKRRMRVTWLHALIWKWRHLEGRASFWVR